jgi:hypothetical protein
MSWEPETEPGAISLLVALGVEDKKREKGIWVRRKIRGWGMRESEREVKKKNE